MILHKRNKCRYVTLFLCLLLAGFSTSSVQANTWHPRSNTGVVAYVKSSVRYVVEEFNAGGWRATKLCCLGFGAAWLFVILLLPLVTEYQAQKLWHENSTRKHATNRCFCHRSWYEGVDPLCEGNLGYIVVPVYHAPSFIWRVCKFPFKSLYSLCFVEN